MHQAALWGVASWQSPLRPQLVALPTWGARNPAADHGLGIVECFGTAPTTVADVGLPRGTLPVLPQLDKLLTGPGELFAVN